MIFFIFSVGNVFSNTFHYQKIIKGCNISSGDYDLLETGIYVSINCLRAASFFLYGWRLCRIKLCKATKYTCKLKCKWFVPLVCMAGFGVTAPVCRLVQDMRYPECHGVTVIAVSHFIIKIIVNLAETTVRTFILCLFKPEWNDVPEYKEISCNDDVQKAVNDKFYRLSNIYALEGSKFQFHHKILKEWFVVQYIIYVLSVLFEFVHVTSKIVSAKPGRDNFDIFHSLLYLCFYLISFLIPYYVGTQLNTHHNAYYQNMLAKYLELKIIKANGSPVSFMPEPRKYKFEEKYAKVSNSKARAEIISVGNEVVEATLSLGNAAKAILREISLNSASTRAASPEFMLVLEEKASKVAFIQQKATKITLSLKSEGSVIKASLQLNLSGSHVLEVVTLSQSHKKNISEGVSELTLDSNNATLCLKERSSGKVVESKTVLRNGTDSEANNVSDPMMEEMYKEYYNLAMMKNFTKKTEFEFVPTIFNIRVPLDDHGLTLALLLAIVSIVFNFGTF